MVRWAGSTSWRCRRPIRAAFCEGGFAEGRSRAGSGILAVPFALAAVVLLASAAGCNSGASPAAVPPPAMPAAKSAKPPKTQRPKPTNPPPDRLKILTYNTWGGRKGVDQMIEFLRPRNADIICLQEIQRERISGKKRQSDQAVRIAKALGLHVVSAATLGIPEQQHCDPAILSRFELVDGQAHSLTDGGWVYAVSARVKTDGRPLHLVSVHTHSTHFGDVKGMLETAKTRMKEVEAIRSIVAKLHGDVIIAGDFNAATWMPEYPLLMTDLADFGSVVDEDKLTFPADKPTLRIDYVFGRGEFAGRAYRVLDANLSDHLPVWAEIQRRESPPSSRASASQPEKRP